jgi:hypothetical protein
MTNTTQRYVESARRAGQWIVDHQKPDGSFFDADMGISGYFKIPYALGISGFVPQSVRLLRWVARNHFTAEGDFRSPQRKAATAKHDDWPTYANSWLIQAAHRLNQFDLSFRGAEYLLRHRTPCGGFNALENGKPYVECLGTSWAGMAQLSVGNITVAAGVAQCLQSLVDQQPDTGRFYFRMTTDGQLITDVPDGAALGYYVDSMREDQIYYHPGVAMIFLCRYYLASGEVSALRTAETIFAFTDRCRPDVYAFPPSGKLGVGCALLASITGKPEPRRAAESLVDYLVETQKPDGYWQLPEVEIYRTIKNKDSLEITMEISSEFTAWLWEIAALL